MPQKRNAKPLNASTSRGQVPISPIPRWVPPELFHISDWGRENARFWKDGRVCSYPGLRQARAFYQGQLGFEFVSLDQYALVIRAGGNKVRIAKLPNFTPLQATILGWEVEDIEAVASWLKNNGVTLENQP